MKDEEKSQRGKDFFLFHHQKKTTSFLAFFLLIISQEKQKSSYLSFVKKIIRKKTTEKKRELANERKRKFVCMFMQMEDGGWRWRCNTLYNFLRLTTNLDLSLSLAQIFFVDDWRLSSFNI